MPVLLTRRDRRLRCGRSSTCAATVARMVVEEGSARPAASAAPTTRGPTTRTATSSASSSRDDFGEVDASCLGPHPAPGRRAGRPGVRGADARRESWTSTPSCAATTSCSPTSTSTTGTSWPAGSSRGRTGRSPTTATSTSTTCRSCTRTASGPNIPNRAIYDAWGPHQRVSVPEPGAARPRGRARRTSGTTTSCWRACGRSSRTCRSPASTPVAGARLVSQLFPGDNADQSVTIQTFFLDHEPDDEERGAGREAG